MGNCLKTQLKESVNNDTLRKFNILSLNVTEKTITYANGAQQKLILQCTEPITVTALDGGYFGEDYVSNIEVQKLTTLTIAAGAEKTLFFKNGTYKVEISNMYAITKISNAGVTDSIVSLNIEHLEYVNGLETLEIEGSDSTGDVSSLSKLTSLDRLQIAKTKVGGNVGSLNSCINLTTLYIANNSYLSGDFKDLSALIKLSALSFTNTPIVGTTKDLGNFKALASCYTNMNTLSGSVEEFVSTQISKGRAQVTASSPVFISNLLKFATFGGDNYNESYDLITWDSATKIAVYCGDSTIAGSTTVYCSGYGSQSAAEAAFPGKTVHVIAE